MITHRPFEPDDRNFIVNSWVASYRDSDTAGMIQVDDWYAVMIPQVNKVLAKPDVETIVACGQSDTSHLYGFICFDRADNPPLVYYVFVKSAYRRNGIAKGLFDAAGIRPDSVFHYVCSTPWASRLERKMPLARWMPRRGRVPQGDESWRRRW